MSFSWKDRESALGSLNTNAPELVILGAGVAGLSTAAHAAKLGLNVVVFDKEDIASGSSGNSTGLAHAGLRYLAQGRLGYVFREGHERYRLQELAPQWVEPFNFIMPVYRDDPFPFWLVRLGTFIYDALGWVDALLARRPFARRHRRLTVEEIKSRLPGIRTENLMGGLEYFVDARLQDARFTLGLGQQAAQHGTRIITHCKVESVRPTGHGPSVVTGRDLLTGNEFKVSAPLVLNATGAWIDELRRKMGKDQPIVRKSKGVHLIVDHLVDSPLILASATKGRVFFVIPIDSERTLVGTTDTPFDQQADDARVDPKDVTELLQQLFRFFPYLKQGEHLADAIENYRKVHVRDLYWGIRPLVQQAGSSLDASRDHLLSKDLPGVWSLVGVKLTAGRAAGHEAAMAAWRAIRPGTPVPTVTWDSLPGGELWDLKRFSQDASKRFKVTGNDPNLLKYLVSMYGTRYVEVLQWAQREDHYGEHVIEGEPWIFAQVVFSVYEELAVTLNDLLWRRTKWAHYKHLPIPVVTRIAELMGRHLGWSAEELERQIQAYALELVNHRTIPKSD